MASSCSAAVGAAPLTAEEADEVEVDERRSSGGGGGDNADVRGKLLEFAAAAIGALRPCPAAQTSAARN